MPEEDTPQNSNSSPADHNRLGRVEPDGLGEREIREQLERIFRSESFAAAPKLRNLLSYIVEQTLAGKQKRIKQYSIATEALGLGEDFDPNTSPAVRLDAARLRSALRTFYSDNPNEGVLISIPKGRYIPIFEAAAHLQYAAQRRAASMEEPGIGLPAMPEPNRLLIVRLFTQASERDLSSIAESLTEQLIVEFAGYPDVSITTLAAVPYASSSTIQTVGLQQKARFVLCGTIKRSGLLNRITLQLHDVKSKTIIWANKFEYDDQKDEAFAAQDGIAGQAAGIIADDFGIIAYRHELERDYSSTKYSGEHNALLHHRHLARTLTQDAYKVARERIEEALQFQPANSRLWAAIAQTMFYGNVLGYDEDKNWIDVVWYSAQRALELDRANHYAQVVMAQYSLFQRDFDSVFEMADELMRKNPRSASNQLSAGYFRAAAGDWERGVGLLKIALGRLHNPPNWAYKVLFLDAYRRRNYEDARRQINLYYVPEHFTPPLLRAAVMMKLNRVREAELAADEVRRIKPNLKDNLDNYLRYLSAFDDLTEALKQPLQKLGLI